MNKKQPNMTSLTQVIWTSFFQTQTICLRSVFFSHWLFWILLFLDARYFEVISVSLPWAAQWLVRVAPDSGPSSTTSNTRACSSRDHEYFQPAKPFLVNLYLKTEGCIRLKLLVWREPLYILSLFWVLHIKIMIMWIKVWDFAMALGAFQVRKCGISGTSKKWALG